MDSEGIKEGPVSKGGVNTPPTTPPPSEPPKGQGGSAQYKGQGVKPPRPWPNHLSEGHTKKFGVNEEPTSEKKNIKPPAQGPTKSKVVAEVEMQLLPEIVVNQDATYISFAEKKSYHIKQLIKDLVNADYNEDGELVGIEIISPVVVKLNSERATAVIPSTILETKDGE